MTTNVRLHQALHGYADGHQLLASSLVLTRNQQSLMLVMSDLSGPSYVAGFESYLTAYPLAEGGFYCIAKTWWAAELPRPGCVWTHSLLISESDLARISDIRGVVGLFRRPSQQLESTPYSHPIDVEIFTFGPRLHSYMVSSRIVSNVVRHLYSSNSCIIIPSDSSRTYEDAVIAVFNQQWPRLRRNFRFCTGALSLREYDFDVAIAPIEVARPERGRAIIITEGDDQTQAVDDDWVEFAVLDSVSTEGQSGLRQFLWRFGPDYNNGREVFRALCEIYLAFARGDAPGNIDQVLSAVGHFFPQIDASQRLKREFFGTGGRYSQMANGESAVLRALVSHPAAVTISAEIAEIETRARTLAVNDLHTAITIATLAHRIAGANAEKFVSGFADAIEMNDDALAEIPISLIVALIPGHPTLLLNGSLWRRPADEQALLSSFFGNTQVFESVSVDAVVRAILAGQAWHALAVACDRNGRLVVMSILNWIESNADLPINVPRPINRLLSDRSGLLIELITSKFLGRRSLKVLSALLDVRSWNVRRIGVMSWRSIAENGFLRLANEHDEIRSRVFLLAVGLEGAEAVLVQSNFSEVYDAARFGNLEDDAWAMLDPFLPWYAATWDRCARLLRGAVRAIVRNSWPVKDFLVVFRNEEQFTRAIEEANRSWDGRRYIRALCKDVAAGAISYEAHHQRALDLYCH